MENSSPHQKLKIVVGLTGDIKSLAALFLLKKQGHEVVAVAVDFWDAKGNAPIEAPPSFTVDLSELKSICDKWSVPFYAVEAKEQFREEVLNNFVVSKILGEKISEEYIIHRFILKLVASKMNLLKATHFATGHLARIHHGQLTKFYHIYKSLDVEHDQSHLLAGLSQEELSRLLLPLAELKESEIQTIADKFSFPKMKKEVSDGKKKIVESICETEFMAKYVEKVTPKSLLKIGPVVDVVNDIYYNDHEGLHYFSPGQAGLNTKTAYRDVDKTFRVFEMEYSTGTVKISSKEKGIPDSCMLVNVEFSLTDLTRPLDVVVKVCASKETYKAKLYFKGKDNCLLRFSQEVQDLYIGEIVAIYDRDDRYSKIIAVGKVFITRKYSILDRLSHLRSAEQLKYRKSVGLYENTFFF